MIDLTAVQNLLDEAEKAVTLLNGRDINDSPGLQSSRDENTVAGRRRAEVAECGRELLRLADNLTTAAALARHEYHVALKGAPDPIFDREQ